jgi:purine-binding chemotaxis protein CheW
MNEPAKADVATRSFCTFRADRRLYGIDVQSLREISMAIAITPVPPAASAVRGLANLRSRILLVLDLRPLLGLIPAPCTQDSRLIIFKSSVAEDTGLLVDSGGNILAVPTDQIETIASEQVSMPSAAGQDAPPPVVAVCKLEKELMMVIDAGRLACTVANLLR